MSRKGTRIARDGAMGMPKATSIAGTGGLHYLPIPGQPTMNAIQARSIAGTGGIHYLHARSITGAGGLQSVQIQGQSTITAHQAISIAGAGELRYLPVTGQPNYVAGSIAVAGGLQVVPVPGQQALSAKYIEHDELIRGILIEVCLVREGTTRLSLLFRQQTISI